MKGKKNSAWSVLHQMAVKARGQAYSPYSKYQVGSAIETGSGKTFSGCNVENASYGATICAERTAIVSAVAAGEKAIQKIVVVTGGAKPATPCGACLQVIAEFATPDCQVAVANLDEVVKIYSLDDLFPVRFGGDNLKGESKR